MVDTHLLRTLQLPARYEPLVQRVGDEVAQLLVEPDSTTREAMERAALAVRARGEGLLVPMFAPSGTGKTTLANNLTAFSPNEFGPTVRHTEEVTTEGLIATIEANPPGRTDDRVIPMNIDHRESAPPSNVEMAALKRFLRDERFGHRVLVLWPETNAATAREIAELYVSITGDAPIELPVQPEGPPRETWVEIALHTLRLSNAMIDDLELMGVDPRNYNPEEFATLGAFLRRISDDFTRYIHQLLTEVRVPARLVIAFCSESQNASVLSALTSGARYGLVDGSALIDSTRDSVIGRYWANHRGTLTQTIVRLDARAVCLPPPATIAALRRHGADELKAALADLGIPDRGQGAVSDALRRTDLGEILRGTQRAAYEARGTPATTAVTAFQVLAEQGFNLGRDKPYNRAIADAIQPFLEANEIGAEVRPGETRLTDTSLIPDNAITFGEDEYVVCIEYTWRSGDFLTNAHRSDVAQYILSKLRNYARELGWIQD